MSHIHLPDGVISPVWWITAWIICLLLILFFARRLKKGGDIRRKIPFIGVVGALMLIFMSIPLGFIPVHLSLAVLCGILAGPELGFTAVFAVNTILSLMGHGGFTTIGLNALIMGGEAVLGSLIFKNLSRRLDALASSVIANIIALALSTALMVLVVSSAVGLTHALPIHDSEGAVENIRFLSLAGWGAVYLIIVLGIITESFITGLIVRFFSKVRPDLLNSAIKN